MTYILYALYALLFAVIVMIPVSIFVIVYRYDGSKMVKVARRDTREQTIEAIQREHREGKNIIYVTAALAAAYIVARLLYPRMEPAYSTLAYAAVALVVSIVTWIGLSRQVNRDLHNLEEQINDNEAADEEARQKRQEERKVWEQQAAALNPQAEMLIQSALGTNYETWYKHDILRGRDVLANLETGVLFAQGQVIPFQEIMQVEKGTQKLKLITCNSSRPYVVIDFGALPINPATGLRYQDEVCLKIEQQIG